jgi:hypothetical protein
MALQTPTRRRFRLWLLEGYRKSFDAPHAAENAHQYPWWRVMCLTGVDYFSTLGYQPGIAFLAAGALSPLATLVLMLLTLFGALPMYNRVAAASPHGDGSISMLEDLLPQWRGKLFVLCLLGFAAIGFIITITLSAADATAHIVENPYVPDFLHHNVALTLVLIAALGAVFLKGFKEAINIAVVIVIIYILLNIIVTGVGFYELWQHPRALADWQAALFHAHGNPLVMIGAALLLFPKLALGLSGFETGVVVMPLVRGDTSDTHQNLTGRIRNTRKLLTTAALIMSVLLIGSSIITTTLIPPEEFQPATATHEAGKAYGRALAYLAHRSLGDVFGTVYDLSTILILWFAGSSAMAGLLNIVPRYLPRYGMAPEWTRAMRPLVLVFTAICFLVTILFEADVNAQGGAYATGVLALMGSAAIAVTLQVWRSGGIRWAFLAISLVFAYTIVVNIVEQPEGLKIASGFIGAIVCTSLLSRVLRSTELRVERIDLDETAQQFIAEATRDTLRVIANQPDNRDALEYRAKEWEQREDHLIPPGAPVLFFEVYVEDASEFSDVLTVQGVNVSGYRVLRAASTAVPNAIAAFLLHLRDTTGKIPHVYFDWTEGNPFTYLLKYIVFGEGYTAPVTREILRQAEPDPRRRPMVHVSE